MPGKQEGEGARHDTVVNGTVYMLTLHHPCPCGCPLSPEGSIARSPEDWASFEAEVRGAVEELTLCYPRPS